MDVIDHWQSKQEAQQMQADREELVERIGRSILEDGALLPLQGFHLHRSSVALEPTHGVTIPAFCVIAQGSKEILLGDNSYQYDPFNYLLATIELPSIGRVLEASEEKPYLGLRLELPPSVVSSLIVETGIPSPPSHANVRAIDVSPMDANLLDAAVRLVRLLDSPADAPILLPMITREIIYRLLKGSQGNRLHHLARAGGYTSDIARAIELLRQDFDQPLRINQIAQEVGMSVSGFHYHFKVVTAMSPLQFQKQIRLQEARRLMLGENFDAASAAFRVGYNDASHFNREYKSVFGVPPMRDVQRLREVSSVFPG